MSLGMFKRNTLFILGAAASPGFPLGADLKTQVAGRLFYTNERGALRIGQHQARVFQEIKNKGISDSRLTQIGQVVREGISLSVSIDNFLELKSSELDLIDCCKLAIADIILACETKATSLRSDVIRQSQLNDFADVWYKIFAQICFQSCPRKSLIPEAISRFAVVSFNYDRCIEQFIRIAVMRLYAVSYDEATELTKELVVLHPYGSLGSLPGPQASQPLAFGQEHSVNLSTIASNLKTFTEQTVETTIIEQIKEAAADATLVAFFGLRLSQAKLGNSYSK